MQDLFEWMQGLRPTPAGAYTANHYWLKVVLVLTVGVLMGFVVFYAFRAPRAGTRPKAGFNFQIYLSHNVDANTRECLHIHHWMLMLLLMALMWITVLIQRSRPSLWVFLVTGVAWGAIFEDLTYPDVFKLKEECIG